jgi:fatty aldehyde-generating acyl-ACP reductase
MKFASLGHLDYKNRLDDIPKSWIKGNLIVFPEIDIKGTKGNIILLKNTAEDLIKSEISQIREIILKACIFAQENFDVNIIQLGGFTTSVTSGGIWLAKQKEYTGYLTHGDSYTAAVTCQAVKKIIQTSNKDSSDLKLAIIGAYGIIGEAVSKILVPDFNHSILIGRRKEKLDELEKKIKGNFETTTQLHTQHADVIITATSHPTALLESEHLKKNAIIVDVSQPPNLNYTVCQQRPDIIRVDGGYVESVINSPSSLTGMPKGKIFSCIAEVIMQAMENKKQNYVGYIDLNHLKQTEKWAQKYGFTLQELTNFGKIINTQLFN